MDEKKTMWEIHTCGKTPTHHCAACWAEAYDVRGEEIEKNLWALGYYKTPENERPSLFRNLFHN